MISGAYPIDSRRVYNLAFSDFTISKYRLALRILNLLPNLIITKNTDEAAMPMKAAEIKQF
jgi:hypothetical protein